MDPLDALGLVLAGSALLAAGLAALVASDARQERARSALRDVSAGGDERSRRIARLALEPIAPRWRAGAALAAIAVLAAMLGLCPPGEEWPPYRAAWTSTTGRPWSEVMREAPVLAGATFAVGLGLLARRGRSVAVASAFIAGVLAGHVFW